MNRMIMEYSMNYNKFKESPPMQSLINQKTS